MGTPIGELTCMKMPCAVTLKQTFRQALSKESDYQLMLLQARWGSCGTGSQKVHAISMCCSSSPWCMKDTLLAPV